MAIYGEDVLPNHNNLKNKRRYKRYKSYRKNLKSHEIFIHLVCISNDPKVSSELNPQLGKSINFDAFEPLVKLSRNLGINLFMLHRLQFTV